MNNNDLRNLHVVVPVELRRQLRIESARRGITMNEIIVTAIRRELRQECND
jgi:hypothetical protein